MIIGLTGTIASGKDALADVLKNHDFVYFSLSDEVREEAKLKGIELTRENLQKLGNAMRKEHGPSVFAKRVAMKIIDTHKNYVLNGIRIVEEIKEFKKWPDFFLISVDAPSKIRFERLLKRNRESDPKTYEAFIKVDEADRGLINTGNPQEVEKCMQIADLKMINDGTIEEWNEKTKKLMEQLSKKVYLQ